MVLLLRSEAELFSDIRKVAYGDLLRVEVLEEGDLVELGLTRKDKGLLALLKEGIRNFDSIRIHDKEPVYVVITGETKHGRLYKQKIQIN